MSVRWIQRELAKQGMLTRSGGTIPCWGIDGIKEEKKEELFSWGSVSLLPESHDVSSCDEPALSASMDRNLSHQQQLASPSLWFCKVLYHIEENLTKSRSRLPCQLSNNGFSLLFSACEYPQSITGTQRTAFLTPQTRAGTDTSRLPVF